MRNLILIILYALIGLLDNFAFGRIAESLEKDTLLVPTVVRRNVLTDERISIKPHTDTIGDDAEISRFAIPSVLIGYGLVTPLIPGLKNIDYSTKRMVNRHIHRRMRIDDFIQYAPAVGVYALEFAGLTPTHNLKQRTLVMATSHLLMGAVVQGMKHSFKVQRPDGSNYKSFPSGHTATAFVGAHILHREYKDECPWIGVAGYAVATTTGIFRVLNKKHWVSDVLTGAGIGILSTEMGYLLLPKVENWFRTASIAKGVKIQRVSYEDGDGVRLTYKF
ncbi:phosphatase PAP2 family protein [Sphingobacterium psychroaquaticum]|uniref:PAP2 superfamily protein n=1 Tax=Sphingobacterium psychroaquaticum TaxID=561061 RepID=A0A1X7JWK6_9SPHI|nr:phosphatase PAP2 family protein [Sphingobacterium psychroaquaticum]SMG32884.1 PAP2 superfamily protein [Sphingobacterium psychroaquaticum]